MSECCLLTGRGLSHSDIAFGGVLGHLGVLGRGCNLSSPGGCIGGSHSNCEHNVLECGGPGLGHVGCGSSVLGPGSGSSVLCVLGLLGPGVGHGCFVVFKVVLKFASPLGSLVVLCLVLIGLKYHEAGDTAEYKAPGWGKASVAKVVVGD